MKLRRSVRLSLATAAIGALGIIGMTGCGPADLTALASPEQSALAALGFTPTDLTTDNSAPTGAPTTADAGPGNADPGNADPGKAGPGNAIGDHPGRKLRFARAAVRRNMLHGEATVQTKDGVKTVEVQRGEVTAIDATSITVKSTDGFTETWIFGDQFHVVQHRSSVQPSAIKVGTVVGVAGNTDGKTSTARLIVVPEAK